MSRQEKLAGIETDTANRGQFRRPRQRVEVRRRAVWKHGIFWTGWSLLLGALALAVGGSGWLLYRLATTAALFEVGRTSKIEVVSGPHVSPEDVRSRFAEDAGQSVWLVPLSERRHAVEEIPWVATVAVQRFLPNRLRVSIQERTPVAFLRRDRALWLVDAHGVVLPMPPEARYSFPVITGLSARLTPEDWRERIRLYLQFIKDMDGGGKNYSAQVSEVDLSDLADVRAIVATEEGSIRLHFGREHYQERFETFLEHLPLLQKSGREVYSADLRYRGQIVLNPDEHSGSRR